MIFSDVIDGILIISGFFIFSTEIFIFYREELLHAIKDRFLVDLINLKLSFYDFINIGFLINLY